MEVQGVEHRSVPLRIQDPGAAAVVFIVRDIDQMLARVRQANADIVTPGGQAVQLTDGARSVLIRDVDGRFIELRQPAALPAAAAAAANANASANADIVDMRLSIAVDDIDRTTQIYRDVLGFKVEGDTALAADPGIRALTGLANVEVRRSRVQAQGSSLWIELVEYDGVDRHPLQMRIQDRGAARLQLRAEHIDGIVAAMKNAGLTVVSEGGGAVPIPPNFRGALVADPNNFFVTPFERCDGCAPTFGTRH
jgi:catechol 2,3-dioxygenase-like lactoylglutathione lyase family enzyme